jgi:Peptidase family M1 domain
MFFMFFNNSRRGNALKLATLFFILSSGFQAAIAQTSESAPAIYTQLKVFSLSGGGTAEVSNLVLKRDRGTMTFTGTFYFAAPVEGRVTGAVFEGQGVFHADVPPLAFERANVKRLLGADSVESTFKTAAMRFTDDTFEQLGKTKHDGPPNEQAQKNALEFERRILKETGANISSRLAVSIENNENPGFFFATFDGGQRGRFSYVFDPQMRMPTASFDINGGEKGLVFSHKSEMENNETWLAFYSLGDYEKRYGSYSDLNDLIDITHYAMNIDLRSPNKMMKLHTRISCTVKSSGIKAIPFTIGSDLSEEEGERRTKQMRLKAASIGNMKLTVAQEDWEGGFTVFSSEPLKSGQTLDLDFDLEGDILQRPDKLDEFYYLRSTSSWFPRHGYLDRATMDMTFRHQKKKKVAATGLRVSELPDAEDKDAMITHYVMKDPVPFGVFALGPFVRYNDSIKWDDGSPPTPIEFNSVEGSKLALNEKFMLTELNNSVRFFQFLFGKYPYESFGATYHPYNYGQGFATMIMIPDADNGNKTDFQFIAHETSHQWWGNVVSWRSYRDQWLSEGFAEYSGVLYANIRKDHSAELKLIDALRRTLLEKPQTLNSVGKGKLFEVGPIILGHRVTTTKTRGAYQALIYSKGALVLRMLHFLFTNPDTGKGDEFYTMMKDFVERYRNKAASTDDFKRVANEHFVSTPVAKQFGLDDLNWFFQQYVYETDLPSYKLEYQMTDQPGGGVILNGNVIQENAREKWFMPLPLKLTFDGGRTAYTNLAAFGPKMPFILKLPSRPQKIELDPEKWILSEKTSSN